MREESDNKELVLGNKQLLSIFFIVIAMLGVAFTLGYMIGRNTANVSAAGVSPAAANQSTPIQSPTPGPQPVETLAPAAAELPAPVTPPQPKVTVTRAAKPYDSETAHATVAGSSSVPAPAPDPVPPASATPGISYLQIAAMKHPDADHMVSVLSARGFPALLRESSKEGLFRVMVGPYKDMASLVDAKQKLKAAGFENPLISH